MDEPLPMWIFVITCGIAGVLSLGLKVSEKGESKEEVNPDAGDDSVTVKDQMVAVRAVDSD